MKIFLILFLFLLSFPVTSQALEKEILIGIGESYLARGSGAIKAQKTDAAEITPISGGVQVFGKKTGETQIHIGRSSWQIQVLNKSQQKAHRVLKNWARSRLGLQVKVAGAEVTLQGRLLRAKDWVDLVKECRSCQYTAELVMSEEVQSQVHQQLGQIFKKRNLGLPSLRWNPEGQWVIGKKGPSQDLKSLASALGLKIEAREETIDPSPMIRTQIYVMEVRRERTRQWGVDWPESVSAQVLPQFKNPVESLSLSAHALEKTGDAKILANPTLLCRSGQEAEFLAGGEFPIKVFNRVQSGVVWRKYGILVKVKPKADRFGKISMTLETEISNIDGARVVDGIPGLLTNRVLSHFDLSGSQTIAISGLIRNDESESVKGLPGLSQIPILGALFSSREFRENRSELVILVKPETLNLSAENRR